jgi:DNA-binding response OmpR family regulator
LQGDLEDAGYRVAGPFNTRAKALAWLESETPDLAVLDTMLKDGPCHDLTAELTRRDVPFVIYSGVLREWNTVSEFMNAVWVEKPAAFSTLLHALMDIRKLSPHQAAGSRP